MMDLFREIFRLKFAKFPKFAFSSCLGFFPCKLTDKFLRETQESSRYYWCSLCRSKQNASVLSFHICALLCYCLFSTREPIRKELVYKMYARTHTYMHSRIHGCIHIYMHARIQACTYTYIYTYTHT